MEIIIGSGTYFLLSEGKILAKYEVVTKILLVDKSRVFV
jgi:hypothetical protein